MKQNIQFLLRVAGYAPFSYSGVNSYSYATNYVFSSYIWGNYSFNHFEPFEDNYFFRNFVFDPTLINDSGGLETGFGYDYGYGYQANGATTYLFPTYDYVTSSNQAPIPGILSSNQTSWVGYFDGDLSPFGVSETGSTLSMSNSSRNVYGLAVNSLEVTLPSSGSVSFATLSPGYDVTGYNGLPVYAGTAEPQLQTIGYIFINQDNFYVAPGYGGFSVTNSPQYIIGAVGHSMAVAGYAQQKVLNGYSNVFAYLGQYFTNAFTISNGIVSTNIAGVLSEHGEFFPTLPGQVALFTKPDPDQTNIQGQCDVDIIRLSLDVNHDGVMDETFTRPDNTSMATPYVVWANNAYDRWHTPIPSIDGTIEDDLETASQPDCNYTVNGNRCIPCPRDLEDYARLWVSGVSNTLSRLPTGSAVTLTWQNNSGATIDLFQAADADGGMGYLPNSAPANNQINTNLCR